MLNLLNGMWAARAIQTAAQLGITDLLVAGPRHVNDLAEATGTHAPSLYRLLRALAGLAIFTELAPCTLRRPGSPRRCARGIWVLCVRWRL